MDTLDLNGMYFIRLVAHAKDISFIRRKKKCVREKAEDKSDFDSDDSEDDEDCCNVRNNSLIPNRFPPILFGNLSIKHRLCVK